MILIAMYFIGSQTLENMSDKRSSLSNSNATSKTNMPKNRYENILPCKNNVKTILTCVKGWLKPGGTFSMCAFPLSGISYSMHHKLAMYS